MCVCVFQSHPRWTPVRTRESIHERGMIKLGFETIDVKKIIFSKMFVSFIYVSYICVVPLEATTTDHPITHTDTPNTKPIALAYLHRIVNRDVYRYSSPLTFKKNYKQKTILIYAWTLRVNTLHNDKQYPISKN